MSAQHFRESLIHWLEYLQVNVRITHVKPVTQPSRIFFVVCCCSDSLNQ